MKLKKKLGFTCALAFGTVASVIVGFTVVSCSANEAAPFYTTNVVYEPTDTLSKKISRSNLETFNQKIVDANPKIFKNNSVQDLTSMFPETKPGESLKAQASNQNITTNLTGDKLSFVISYHLLMEIKKIIDIPNTPMIVVNQRTGTLMTTVMQFDFSASYSYNLTTPHLKITTQQNNLKVNVNGIETPAGTIPNYEPMVEDYVLDKATMTNQLNTLYQTGKNEHMNFNPEEGLPLPPDSSSPQQDPNLPPNFEWKTFPNLPDVITFKYGYSTDIPEVKSLLPEKTFDAQVQNVFKTRVNIDDTNVQEAIKDGIHSTYYYVVIQDKLYCWNEVQMPNPDTNVVEKMYNHTTVSLVPEKSGVNDGKYEIIETVDEGGQEGPNTTTTYKTRVEIQDILSDFSTNLHP